MSKRRAGLLCFFSGLMLIGGAIGLLAGSASTRAQVIYVAAIALGLVNMAIGARQFMDRRHPG
jgi:hypothetical protein